MSNRLHPWASLQLLLLLVAPAAPAGARSAVPGRASSSTASIHGDLRGPASRANANRTSLTSAVVWLEEVPVKVERRLSLAASQSRVRQSGLQFAPRIQVVTVGSRVMFENQDKVFHNVFTRSPENVFDTGQYAPGRSRHVMFDSVGVVQLYCAIHPEMSGTVVVVPNHAWTRPGPDGKFEIAGLTTGTYRLRVWHPVHGTLRSDVDVPMPKNTILRLRFGGKPQLVQQSKGKSAAPDKAGGVKETAKSKTAKPRTSVMPGSQPTATTQPLRKSGGRLSR